MSYFLKFLILVFLFSVFSLHTSAQLPSFELFCAPYQGCSNTTSYPFVDVENVVVQKNENTVTITAFAYDVSSIEPFGSLIAKIRGSQSLPGDYIYTYAMHDNGDFPEIDGQMLDGQYGIAFDVSDWPEGEYIVDLVATDNLLNNSWEQSASDPSGRKYANVGTFTIGSVMSSTAYLDPESDAANNNWNANSDLYDALNDAPDSNNIQGDPIGRGTGETDTLDMDMETYTVTGAISQIDVAVWINGMQQSTVYVNIYVNGEWQTHQQVYTATDYEEPGTQTAIFDVSALGLDQTDIDNLRVRLEATATEGNQGGAYIDSLRAQVYDEGAGGSPWPTGDIANTKWRRVENYGPTTNLYTMIDDGIRYGGDVSNYWDTIRMWSGPSPVSGIYDMNMTTADVGALVSEIRVWVYVTAPNRNNDLYVNIYVGAGWTENPIQILTSGVDEDVEEWKYAAFDVSGLGLDQSDIDALQVRLSNDVNDGWLFIPYVYAEVTYTGAVEPPPPPPPTASGFLDPQADMANFTLSTEGHSFYHNAIDKRVRQPIVPSVEKYISGEVDSNFDVFRFSTLPVFGTVSSITVWAYGKSDGAGLGGWTAQLAKENPDFFSSGCPQGFNEYFTSVDWGGVGWTPAQNFSFTDSWGWSSVTFNDLNYTQKDIDNLIIKLNLSTNGSDFAYLSAVYAALDYALSDKAYLDPNSLWDWNTIADFAWRGADDGGREWDLPGTPDWSEDGCGIGANITGAYASYGLDDVYFQGQTINSITVTSWAGVYNDGDVSVELSDDNGYNWTQPQSLGITSESQWQSTTFTREGGWSQDQIDKLQAKLTWDCPSSNPIYLNSFYAQISPYTPPSLTNVYITPNPAGNDDSLICNFTASDPDVGDIITADVTWYKSFDGGQNWMHHTENDELNIPIESGVPATTSFLGNVEPEYTGPGEMWACEVVAKDSHGLTSVLRAAPSTISY